MQSDHQRLFNKRGNIWVSRYLHYWHLRLFLCGQPCSNLFMTPQMLGSPDTWNLAFYPGLRLHGEGKHWWLYSTENPTRDQQIVLKMLKWKYWFNPSNWLVYIASSILNNQWVSSMCFTDGRGVIYSFKSRGKKGHTNRFSVFTFFCLILDFWWDTWPLEHLLKWNQVRLKREKSLFGGADNNSKLSWHVTPSYTLLFVRCQMTKKINFYYPKSIQSRCNVFYF